MIRYYFSKQARLAGLRLQHREGTLAVVELIWKKTLFSVGTMIGTIKHETNKI